MALPQVPECSVRRGADGLLYLTHKRTKRTLVADPTKPEHVDTVGAILRCLAAYAWQAS